MSARFEPIVFRPLPRPLKPFPQETEASFLDRLAAANAMPVRRLQQPSLWLTSRLDPTDQLSVLSGQPRTSIQHAIPRWEKQAWNLPQGPFAATIRWACRRCVARRTGNPDQGVMVWMSKHHEQVCVPHRLWIGRAVESPATQFDLADLPEIVAAQQRHYRLLRRHGPHVLNPCYAQISLFWHVLIQHGYRISDRSRRLVRLQPRPARSVRPWDPKRYAAVYPEIVTTMALYASPYWRRLAMSTNEEDFRAFHAEFTRRLPNESPLRTTAKPWFIQQLRTIAHTIQDAAGNPGGGNTTNRSEPVPSG
ncbi:hypothetical protein EJ357_21075 [Streptomyces cyaneochromogenes]|uniref:TniQ protein n=1 Tax=Streptomyces cyaneochromogenes TaxID=2496836 RepID=A0A3S9M975_9ACTN|nr:hypothetical protein [Streptomyces cyaneochromogenes]AZQ35681.1 hypothetical protein EJ357_21075 [Streptomyces cyaneochromogenes]